MKTKLSQPGSRGIMLIECLVYFALFAVVIGLAYSAYCRVLDNSRHLQRNAADITLALNAGERWRDDLRLSSGLAISEHSCVLTQAAGCVEYTFAQNAVWRRADGRSSRLLAHVKNSSMQREPRRRVTAVRWELELETTRPDARVKPLFTFKTIAPFQP